MPTMRVRGSANICLGGVLALLLSASLLEADAAATPNVLFLFVDDLGFNDLSWHNSSDVKSPNIDKLAEGGAHFWNTYSTAGFCSPSRASLMTGRSPAMFGYVFNPPHSMEDSTMGLPTDMTIIPQTLNTAGYDSYILGKWHLGFNIFQHPLRRGFKDFFGFLGGLFPYFQPEYLHPRADQVPDSIEYIYDRWTVPENISYLTNDLTDKSMEYMTRSHNAGKPFFVYLSYNAPHGPYEYKPEDVDPEVSPDRQPHVAMIKAIDDDVGRLMEFLENLGIANDTLVIFSNDNGGHPAGAVNFPLRQFKGSFWEGGIRVPFFLYWKNKIAPNQNITAPITLMDIYPTLQALAEVTPENQNPVLEGTNLLPYVKMVGAEAPEAEGEPHEHICLSARTRGFLRKDGWKLLTDDQEIKQLFNLEEDISETTDLKDVNRTLAEEMLEIFKGDCDPTGVPWLFPIDFRVNPMNVTLHPPTERVVKETDLVLTTTSSHAEGKNMVYVWEVFRPKHIHIANFHFIRIPAGPLQMSPDRKSATIRFKRAGTFIVRVMVKDGEWYKVSDVTVNVKNYPL